MHLYTTLHTTLYPFFSFFFLSFIYTQDYTTTTYTTILSFIHVHTRLYNHILPSPFPLTFFHSLFVHPSFHAIKPSFPYQTLQCTSTISKGSCLSHTHFQRVFFFMVLMTYEQDYYTNDTRNTFRNPTCNLPSL